jgi:kynureninase
MPTPRPAAYHRETMVTTRTEWTIDGARELDAQDPIGYARTKFALPDGTIYLNGNSLGPLPVASSARVRQTIEQEWGLSLSRGWSGLGWMDAPRRLGDRIARLIGALPGEVLVADTTSVALTKVLGAALAAKPGRKVVVSSTDNFPSDLYVAANVARRAGATLRVVDRPDLAAALDDDVAVLCLTQVDFRTGALLDVPAITNAAHAAGALCLWDLCHSAGVAPVGCQTNGVDLAVGCTYKYLNAGPGAPSFLYVRRELQETLENPIPGWLGHAEPFEFDLGWRPAPDIRKFLTSTPPVLALSALDAALDVFDGIDIEEIRAKSKKLGQLFVDVVLGADVPGLELASPASPDERGGQVSLRHPRAAELLAEASTRGVIGDLRPPALCRFGLTPLALSFEDVFRGARAIVDAARSLG